MNLAGRPWLIAILFGLLTLSPAQAGMTPEEVKRYEENMAKAHKGNATAQTGVAICYSIGMGVEKDEELAVFWWRKAAEQGEATAQSLLGLKYKEAAASQRTARRPYSGGARQPNRVCRRHKGRWLTPTWKA